MYKGFNKEPRYKKLKEGQTLKDTQFTESYIEERIEEMIEEIALHYRKSKKDTMRRLIICEYASIQKKKQQNKKEG